MALVEIKTIENCPFCAAARDLLSAKGVEFVEANLTGMSDSDRRSFLEQLCGRTTAPQIWIDAKHIGGFTDLDALDRSGDLDRLLSLAS